jgi:hypothetical protein
MKSLFCTTLFSVAFATLSFGQLDAIKKAPSAVAKAKEAKFDANAAVTSVMGALTPALTLTTKQQPLVQEAIKGYFTQKANIIPMQLSNPGAYNEKQRSYFGSLKSKLTGILLQNQMNKFLGLKPAKPDAANVLSQLFF